MPRRTPVDPWRYPASHGRPSLSLQNLHFSIIRSIRLAVRERKGALRILAFTQRYVAAIPWNDMNAARSVLTRTNAFVRPEEGDEKGIRLRIPDAADLAAAEV
jgi:hypothetical protein